MGKSPVRIVLLGGGYVTVWAYRSLVKALKRELRKGQIKIIVVCPYEHHFYHGWTAECLTGIIRDESRMSSLHKILPKADLLVGMAECWDEKDQTVYINTKEGERLAVQYDHLLFGTGSYDSESLEGIKSHGFQIKDPVGLKMTSDFIRKLVLRMSEADSQSADKLIKIVIVGGGLTGVEIAANIAEWINSMTKSMPDFSNTKPQIIILNRGSHILGSIRPAMGQLVNYAEKTIDEYGITVLNNVCASKVTSFGITISNGLSIECDMVISTLGQSRSILTGTESLPRDTVQRLLTNCFQQVNNLPNVWGGGDACHVKHFYTGEPCISNALWAIKHGEYVGLNIARAIKGQSLKPFSYKGLGQAASLGIGKGITELYGMQFTGRLAWIMRWFFFQYFIPSRQTMFQNSKEWLLFFMKGKRY